ncbi:MAG: DegT/DnrJ/EryC1/StrS family aminotransferase [bacterium]
MIANEIIKKYAIPDPIYVTRPRMPKLSDYQSYLEKIWETCWLTNDGPFHLQFERRLKEYLKVAHLNIFTNGTIALLVALHALRINSGEVITTPFTFPATAHVLYWNRIQPVFCDIDEKTFNMDPSRIEQLIGPDTKAILPVHVYGTPCDVEALQAIADRHGLLLIYDAAHAFGVRIGDRSILEYGDISALSFHATKLFTSIEGGALVTKSVQMRDRIQYLRNFGIADETTVIGPGINGKMSEFQAGFGILQLEIVDQEIEDRCRLTQLYREILKGVPGITFLKDMPNVRSNYSYFPILVDPDIYGMDRDELCDLLRQCNIFPRKYFYPLCSDYSCYSSLPSSQPGNLPVAKRLANQVLCLPLYGKLDRAVVEIVCSIIREPHT